MENVALLINSSVLSAASCFEPSRSVESPRPRAFLIAAICASIDDKAPFESRHFLTEKARRLRGELRARTHVFRQKHGDELVCHLGCDVGALVFEANRESDRFFLSRFQFLFGRFDEGPLADEIDDFRTRNPFQPTRRELVLFRNGEQIVAGHHPLFDDLNAIVGERRDCRADKVAGDFLRLHKDGALRDVSRGPDDGNQGADREDRQKGDSKIKRAPLQNVIEVLRRQRSALNRLLRAVV